MRLRLGPWLGSVAGAQRRAMGCWAGPGAQVNRLHPQDPPDGGRGLGGVEPATSFAALCSAWGALDAPSRATPSEIPEQGPTQSSADMGPQRTHSRSRGFFYCSSKGTLTFLADVPLGCRLAPSNCSELLSRQERCRSMMCGLHLTLSLGQTRQCTQLTPAQTVLGLAVPAGQHTVGGIDVLRPAAMRGARNKAEISLGQTNGTQKAAGGPRRRYT